MKCQKEWPVDEMESEHITPWSLGSATILTNLKTLCKDCNHRKGAK